VKALDTEMGSITGGGRYDNLTGVFGLPGVSGVGISFGADRIYDVLNTLNLYPPSSEVQTKILFAHFGEQEKYYCLDWLKTLRHSGINAEIYPDDTKMKKQMSYANDNNIPFVAIAGETEVAQGKVMLKNMQSGEQNLCSIDELVSYIR
jgi:histidyl-tRNA synthetase